MALVDIIELFRVLYIQAHEYLPLTYQCYITLHTRTESAAKSLLPSCRSTPKLVESEDEKNTQFKKPSNSGMDTCLLYTSFYRHRRHLIDDRLASCGSRPGDHTSVCLCGNTVWHSVTSERRSWLPTTSSLCASLFLVQPPIVWQKRWTE